MNYVLIQNDGEIETNSFELIGASTKRDATGKIGFFGSGLKYSIAYMMRNGIAFRIFSGMNEVVFTTIPDTIKDKSFDRICINGKPTSFTVTMGPTWKEDWYVLREIYCNALDETGCQIIKETEHVSPSEGKTRIYIQQTEKLKDVCDNWGSYFSEDRTPIFTVNDVYVSILSDTRNQALHVFPKTVGVMYRKGIRVSENKRQLFDYGLDHITINEDRTATYPGFLKNGICGAVATLENPSYVKTIFRDANLEDTKKSLEYEALNEVSDAKFSPNWESFSKDHMLVVKEISARYVEMISNSKREVSLLPAKFASELKTQVPSAVVLGMGAKVGDVAYEPVEMDKRSTYLINSVLESLTEMGYGVAYEIKLAEFNNEHTDSHHDKDKKLILLSTKVLDKGRKELAIEIMRRGEQMTCEIIDDERPFGHHIVSKWLTSMENNSGLFL